MNEFCVFFANGDSTRVTFPLSYTMEDVMAHTGGVEVMFVCVVSL
ncbi:hypothetical protein PHB09_159 [Pseudomonas phage PHB09]|uniref:Uncharacterized protein n=1 Tax=Pseudomonas phage PHB09 TaxID=2867265 RepID=A0AAE8XCF7_9CAUD|nr:hypothetical protein QGX10_gp158 [Pseudomonas phage PHB09]UAV84654.1 hypothetical protein PHB09_159 [Pseudomonas phage PHB09]